MSRNELRSQQKRQQELFRNNALSSIIGEISKKITDEITQVELDCTTSLSESDSIGHIYVFQTHE